MKKIKELVLVLVVGAAKDFREMNPECPDRDGKYRFDLT